VRWLSSRPARTVDLKAELNDPAASLAREADAKITAPVLNPMGAGKAGADYPAAVVRTLVGDFPSLANSLTAELVRAAVERQHRQPEPTFECIVDHPTLSTWKLVLHRDEPARLRLHLTTRRRGAHRGRRPVRASRARRAGRVGGHLDRP